jgi:thiol-disulfide isomerase/thioredoxin
MKKQVLKFSVLAAIILMACDKIKHPAIATEVAVGTNFITKSNQSVSNFRKVMLEDYTGPYCGNCPPAAIVAASLEAQYTSSLVVIAVHAGFYAWPHGVNYPGTYTTSVGEDWDGTSSGFGVSAAGNPNGLINRKNYGGSGLIQAYSKWAGTIATALQDPLIIKLDVTTKYDTSARALNTEVLANFRTTYTNNINISLIITEDKIIGNQNDYSKEPKLVTNYEFNHMLRAGINGSWGTLLRNAPVTTNDTIRVAFNNYALPTKINDRQTTLVVFAYDANNREVLQVEKLKIR